MSAEPKVRFMRDGALATVTLASPPLNLIGQQLISDLLAAIDEVEAAEGLRALVLRGEGKVFSAGADVALFAGMTAQVKALTEMTHVTQLFKVYPTVNDAEAALA